MAFPMLDTPRTDVGDQTRLSAAGALDFTTETSIPSPSRENNDLLRQIRGLRAPNKAVITTPRARQPLLDRRNVPSKTEFTPLLKSATRNRGVALGSSFGKENGPLQTPAGLKASYHGRDSPALPLSSSIMEEQYTGSFLVNDGHGTPVMPPSSSSAMSTPMAVLPGRGEGPLDHGNMATLREQEARLEQIDKQNFSLKLKIHFLEEALKRNGKEFNEAAIRENTELKVDKVTLQRDLKHYRRLLGQAEKNLEDCKQKLLEYAEQGQQAHTDPALFDELDKQRRDLSDKEEQIRRLEHDLEHAEDEGYNRCNDENRTALNELRDTIADLEADLRDRERQLDECRDQIDKSDHQQATSDSQKELDELRVLLQENDDDIKGLHTAMQRAGAEYDMKLKEKDSIIERKDDQLRDLEDQLKSNSHDRSFAIRAKDQEVLSKDKELEQARNRLEQATEHALELERLKKDLEATKDKLALEMQTHVKAIEDKDREVHALQQKLASSSDRDGDSGELKDRIADLEADLRERDRDVDQRDDQIDEMKAKLQQLENETDDELIAAQDRIQELEIEQGRNLKDLDSLRNASLKTSGSKADLELAEAKARIQELEDRTAYNREEEQRLQKDIDQLRNDRQRLEQSVKDRDDVLATEKLSWLSQRQSMEFSRSAAEKQAEDHRKTIAQLQQIQGSFSGKESQLQKMLDSEHERHEIDEARLRQEISRTMEEKSLQHQLMSELRKDLQQVRQELQTSHDQEQILQQKIVDLEEEIEVLQGEADEDVERVRKQLRDLEQDYVQLKTDRDDAEAELQKLRISRPAGSSSPLSPTRNNPRDLGALDIDLETSSRSSSHLQQQLQHAKTELLHIKQDKRALEDTVAASSTELSALQLVHNDLEGSHSILERQLREVRAQLSQLQREGDRKLSSQVTAYENDIQNLEQDLADAQVKQDELLKMQEKAGNTASRQRSHIASLEAEIAALRNTSGIIRTTSPGERSDLHEMLKDAKLEAEDLALQLKERDTRISAALSKETELRSQLRRAREDRAATASRVNTDLAEPELLRNQVLQLETRSVDLRKVSRSNKAALRLNSDATEKRHTAELKGLVRQIEYLSARCRREEAFRSDLGFVKQYFQKTVEMYGRCNALDLKLVRSMGIATSQIMRDEKANERLEGPGRVALAGSIVGRTKKRLASTDQRSRPTFKVVGLMVLAGVRMQANAEKWAVVRGRHEELLKKLRVMRKDKEGHAEVAQALGKRKTLE